MSYSVLNLHNHISASVLTDDNTVKPVLGGYPTVHGQVSMDDRVVSQSVHVLHVLHHCLTTKH